MISVTRSPEPAILRRNGLRWLITLQTAIQNQQQLEQDHNSSTTQVKQAKQAVHQAQGKYRHEQIKAALVSMFHDKCAYCESKVSVTSYGAIEHFRPKSRYPDLTFTWSNLLLACDRCNDAGHKGDQFPVDEDGNPLLIDPTDPQTDPQEHLEFVWDEVTKLASIYGKDDRGLTVEKIFDLNGRRDRQALMQHRSSTVKKLWALLKIAQTSTQASVQEEAWHLVWEACQTNAEYSAFALHYIAPYLPPRSA